jgi:agmatinase
MKRQEPWIVCLAVVFLGGGALAQEDLAGVDPEDEVIHLDATDEDRDPSSGRRPDDMDAGREPGVMWIGRTFRPGVKSFFGLPVALTPEDLRAAEVDVAIFGAPIDMGVGMRGAGKGPDALRANITGTGSSGALPHMHVGVAWKRELTAVDYGNAPIDILSVERSMPPVRRMVREIAETGAIPVVVGGDHSLEYPNVAGVADVYGKANVGVIHFDAHFDAGDPISGHLISHAQPIRRLVDDGHIHGKNYIQVGLRGYWPGEDGFNWMRDNGMRYHTMAEIERDGWDVVMDRILNEAFDGPEYLYISFDIDVLDPAYTPGTGTPESGGLTPREVFPLLRTLCSENKLVGFDVVELNPLVDPGYTTVLNTGRLLQECLTGIAMRKKGISERDYYNPLTVDDLRPDP